MVDLVYTSVKVLHVVSAALWIGAGVFNLFVVQKALAATTLETRRDLGPGIFAATLRYINGVGGVTILSGFVLLYLHPHGMAGLTASNWGKMVVAATVLSFAVLYLLNFAVRPTVKAIGILSAKAPKDLPPPANLRFLMLRLKVTSIFNIVLMLAIFGLMVGANVVYFGPA